MVVLLLSAPIRVSSFRAVVLSLWAVMPLGVEQPFLKGYTSDSLHIRYLHYNS